MLTARENTDNMQEACAIASPANSLPSCIDPCGDASQKAAPLLMVAEVFHPSSCHPPALKTVMGRTLGLDLRRPQFKSWSHDLPTL